MRQEDLRLKDKSSLVGPKMYLQTQNIQRAQWECYVRHCCMWQRCGHWIDAIGEWYSTMFVRNRRPEHKRTETTAHERTLLIPPPTIMCLRQIQNDVICTWKYRLPRSQTIIKIHPKFIFQSEENISKFKMIIIYLNNKLF